MNRLSTQDLETLIALKLLDTVNAKETFTAYQITEKLRAANPNTMIFHNDVRIVVHHLMDQSMQSGLLYTIEDRAYTNKAGEQVLAITYVPQAVPAQLPSATIQWDA